MITLTKRQEGEAKDVLPSILFSVTPRDGDFSGRLTMTGACTHVMAVTEVEHIGLDDFPPEDVAVLLNTGGKSAVVDSLDKIVWGADGRKKFGGVGINYRSEADMLTVEIIQDKLLSISQGVELIAELEAIDVDLEVFRNILDRIDTLNREDFEGPIMLNSATMWRLSQMNIKEISSQSNIDIAGVYGYDGKVLAFRVGEELAGFVSLVDRTWFANDANFGDTFGTSKMLLDRE